MRTATTGCRAPGLSRPRSAILWTPGLLGMGGSPRLFFMKATGGRMSAFYGGINYGFGYGGEGWAKAAAVGWQAISLYSNIYVNRVNTTIIHNTYNTRV